MSIEVKSQSSTPAAFIKFRKICGVPPEAFYAQIIITGLGGQIRMDSIKKSGSFLPEPDFYTLSGYLSSGDMQFVHLAEVIAIDTEGDRQRELVGAVE